MPSLALGLWVIYFAVAFGLRAWLSLRSVGKSGLVPLSKLTSARERIASVLVVVALAGGFMSVLLGMFWPDVGLWGVWSRVALRSGGFVVVAGLAATFSAQLAMGDSWRIGVDPGERTELVARGPFRWVRNPIFSAMCLTGAGLVLVAPSWLALGSYALLWLALELQVRGVEEPYLLGVHGDAYRRYAERTGRFVPYVGRGLTVSGEL